MQAWVRNATRLLIISTVLPLAAACTISSPGSAPKFIAPIQIRPSVPASLADPCAEAAAQKYFMSSDRVVAIDTRPAGAGFTNVVLKVDSRDAVCTISDKGVVRSVIDTSPMSADQAAAEAAAAAKAPKGKAKAG
ncbi:MAG: hypothetical protein ACRECW_14935 [Phyllobacterium sp.]